MQSLSKCPHSSHPPHTPHSCLLRQFSLVMALKRSALFRLNMTYGKKLALWDVCVWTIVQARTITLTVPTLFIQTTSCYMTGDEYAKMLSIYYSMLINKKPYISTFNVNEVKICIDQRRLRIGKMFSLLLEPDIPTHLISYHLFQTLGAGITIFKWQIKCDNRLEYVVFSEVAIWRFILHQPF